MALATVNTAEAARLWRACGLAAVMRRTDLSASAKCLLWAIGERLEWPAAEWPRNADLANAIGTSVSVVQAATAALRSAHVIDVVSAGGGRAVNVFGLHAEFVAELARDIIDTHTETNGAATREIHGRPPDNGRQPPGNHNGSRPDSGRLNGGFGGQFSQKALISEFSAQRSNLPARIISAQCAPDVADRLLRGDLSADKEQTRRQAGYVKLEAVGGPKLLAAMLKRESRETLDHMSRQDKVYLILRVCGCDDSFSNAARTHLLTSDDMGKLLAVAARRFALAGAIKDPGGWMRQSLAEEGLSL